jgi:BirA family transcriptional regulator, biotin operon repressor / biotin---[acetyl-CoA-carboxylase] ligase
MNRSLMGKSIVILDMIDSTNSYGINLLKNQKVEEGTVIISSFQSKGRGNAQNIWESEKGKNLTFSIILYPEFLELSNQFIISKAISLGIVDFLKLYIDNVCIKWPNDIYVSDKKIAGILIENFIRDSKFEKTIVGIGINMNQLIFKSDAPNPVSLKNITGTNYDLNECLQLVLDLIDNRYQMLKSYDGINKTNHEYIDLLYKFGVFSNFEFSSQKFSAKITGVDDSGKLMLIDENNNSLVFGFKEVKFI